MDYLYTDTTLSLLCLQILQAVLNCHLKKEGPCFREFLVAKLVLSAITESE